MFFYLGLISGEEGGLFRLTRPPLRLLDTRHDIYGRFSRETDATDARLLVLWADAVGTRVYRFRRILRFDRRRRR